MNRLADKVAVISGGVQGIGQATALRAASEGAAVVIGDLQTDDRTAKQIVANGGKGHSRGDGRSSTRQLG